jgi:hypothetical protein
MLGAGAQHPLGGRAATARALLLVAAAPAELGHLGAVVAHLGMLHDRRDVDRGIGDVASVSDGLRWSVQWRKRPSGPRANSW